MQIKARRVEHEVTASEVNTSDKPSVVFDMRGAWIAICVGTEAHPKQKEIFPERSQPGRGTWAEEETKRREQELGPDPQWGVETCNYTSQRKQHLSLSHKTWPYEKEDHVYAAFVRAWVFGSYTFCIRST